MEYQSKYQKEILATKDQLDRVSPTICVAKWHQVSINLTSGLTQSCYHPPAHKVSLEELAKGPDALHNTAQKRTDRQQMRAGLRPPGCEYCWKVEDSPGHHLSDRFYRSSEPWARGALEDILKTDATAAVTPRYVEVNFNSACNLKCSYCSPHISSTWLQEIREFGPYPTIEPHNDLSYFRAEGLLPIPSDEPNPYLDAFWKWWPQLYPSLKVFRMTGGEPLLDHNTYRILEWIDQHPNPDLDLAVTSNLSSPPKLVDRFVGLLQPIMNERKVGRFMLFASVDSAGAQAEYIRNGLNFDYFWSNVERILTEIPQCLVTLIVTMNCLSVPGLQNLMRIVSRTRKTFNRTHYRLFFDTPFLTHPNWQSLQILTPDFYDYLHETINFMRNDSEIAGSYSGFRDFELARLERVVSWMKLPVAEAELTKSRMNFYRFFAEHDRRRGTDFKKTFPEMEAFWDLCKNL